MEFVDADEIADYAKQAVACLTAFGALEGYEDGSFRPNGSLTRAIGNAATCRAIKISSTDISVELNSLSKNFQNTPVSGIMICYPHKRQ